MAILKARPTIRDIGRKTGFHYSTVSLALSSVSPPFPETMSLPEPPETVSLPRPPNAWSLPLPPMIVDQTSCWAEDRFGSSLQTKTFQPVDLVDASVGVEGFEALRKFRGQVGKRVPFDDELSPRRSIA